MERLVHSVKRLSEKSLLALCHAYFPYEHLVANLPVLHLDNTDEDMKVHKELLA